MASRPARHPSSIRCTGKDLLIEIRKPGYETQFRNPSRTLNVGMVDAVVGVVLLIPLIGLLSSGAWRHDPANYGVLLSPADREPDPQP